MKLILRFLLQLFFRFRAYNTDALKTPGPILLLSNHVSWFDWLFLGVCLDDQWRFVTSSETAKTSLVHRFIMINRSTFPVDTGSPYAVKRMAEYLQSGGKLVLFPEGRLSRTGALMKLFDGTGFLMLKTGAKVITCNLRGAHRLPFSPNPDRKRCFPRMSAHFSELLTPPQLTGLSTVRARQILTRWLYDIFVKQQFEIEFAATPGNILDAVAETAWQWPGAIVMEDVSRRKFTYRRLLTAADALSSQWRSVPTGRIGVILPNTTATPVTLLSLWAAGKVPAIFNYSTGIPTMLSCAQLAGIKQIITSRTFLERAKLDLAPMASAGIEFIYLEDINISTVRKLLSCFRATFNRVRRRPGGDGVAVILFTSGSEGPPKGVELTHVNILANIRQLLAVTDFTDRDRVFNALPLFHSFGLMGLLAPLVRGFFVFLYPSPLHYRVIPTLVYELDCTIFFGTNTFLNGYARKANPYDFRTIRYLVAGAEKLNESTANIWARRMGVRISEGYGATECSPVISINTLLYPNFGSAGRFLPGIEHKLEPVPGVTEGGRLWVRGPNIMRGYINPDANSKFKALGGWYDTGDIAAVDDDGSVRILGRLKRFAKVSGEMVSLTAAEEALAGGFPQYGLRFQIAVLSRPDPDRGEVLVAVANDERLQMEEIRAVIKAKGLGNLYVPREIKYVRDIPKLGTGKVNHLELQKIVLK